MSSEARYRYTTYVDKQIFERMGHFPATNTLFKWILSNKKVIHLKILSILRFEYVI